MKVNNNILQRFLRKSVGIFSFLLCPLALFGGKEPILRNAFEENAIRVDSLRIIEDEQFKLNNLGAYNLYKAENFVSLEINQDQLMNCYLDSFWFKVKVKITSWDKNGDSTVEEKELEVYYDQRPGKEYNGISTYRFSDKYKVKITILEVSDVNLTDFIRVSGEIHIERYKDLDVSTIPSFVSLSNNTTTGELEINWNTLTGAEEYDLEWTFVDDYNGISTTGYLSASALSVDFENNSSRVTVKGNTYSIANVFEHGYVAFRVRGAGYTGEHFNFRIQGRWSNELHPHALTGYSSAEKIQVTQLEPTFNWQFVNTFSEEGKKKELVSFMDGSYRNRQTVTRISSDTTVIVGETVYDHQGRPAMQILPVPVDEQKLKFYNNFNLDSISGNPYDRSHFDLSTCNVPHNPLKTTSGAGEYYSGNNDFLSQGNHWLAEHNPYIPNSYGYPYVRTLYTSDNSGRPSRVSGVGKDHNLFSLQATRYFYGSPFQEELDRLFGNAVGHYTHYEKEMVVDPNGQVSISFKDLSGKVIATSLGGGNPGNTDVLDNNPGTGLVNVKLESDAELFPDDYSLKTVKTFNVAVISEYRIFYSVDLEQFQDECMPTNCHDCVYELELSLKDECGEEMLDGDSATAGIQPFFRLLMPDGQGGYRLTCENSVTYKVTEDEEVDGDSIRITLDIGNYTLSKILRVSDEAAEYYADDYMANNTCLKTEEDFIAYHKSLISDFNCNITCAECEDMLSDSANYVAERYNLYVSSGWIAGQELWDRSATEFTIKKAACAEICNTRISPCEYMLIMLETDVSENGQYKEFAGDITLHPEYCRYQFCTQNEESFEFERYLLSIDNGSIAIANGLMDLLKNTGKFPDGVYDTFFYDDAGRKSLLISKLDDVVTFEENQINYSFNALQTAVWVANFKDKETYAEIIAEYNAYDYSEAGQCISRDTYMWHLYRGIYLTARREAMREISQQTGQPCEGKSVPVGKKTLFPSREDIADDQPDEQEANQRFANNCDEICGNQADTWMQLIGSCVMDHPQKEEIRAALIAICVSGCDPYNPLGSSTSPDGTASFQTVLKDFEIYDAGKCDARKIDIPGEFNNSKTYVGTDSSNWSCLCPYAPDTCAKFMANPLYKEVLMMFYAKALDIDCDDDLYCYTCEEVYTAYSKFYEEVGDTAEFEDTSANWPLILANHMNHELELELGYYDYVGYINRCANYRDSFAYEDSVFYYFRQKYLGTPPAEPIFDDYMDSLYQEYDLAAIPVEMPAFPGSWQDLSKTYAFAGDELLGSNYLFGDNSMPDVPPMPASATLNCDGYVLLNTCMCASIMDKYKNTIAPGAFPTQTEWATLGGNCVSADSMEKLFEACLLAYFVEEDADEADIGDTNAWSPQAKLDLQEWSIAHNMYLSMSCLSAMGIDCGCPDEADPGDPGSGDPGSGGTDPDPDPTPVIRPVVIYPEKPQRPDPIPELPCDSLLKYVDSFLLANMDWLSMVLTDEHIQLIANHVDSLFSGSPYFRLGNRQTQDYRNRRLKAEMSRCGRFGRKGGGKKGCSGTVDMSRIVQYFSCVEELCYVETENNRLLRDYLRTLTLRVDKQSSFTPKVNKSNLLSTRNWNKVNKQNITFYNTNLYVDNFENDLEYTYSFQSGTGSGPREFVIDDGNGFTMKLRLAFFSADIVSNFYSQLRGVISIEPVITAPCDSFFEFNLKVLIEDSEGKLVERDMFGWTDTYPLIETCVYPKLCRNKNQKMLADVPCPYDFETVAEATGRQFYGRYIDSIRKDYIHRYKMHCLNQARSSEILSMTFEAQEYHYTLYYYDLAGNLIQTVPPGGVQMLNAAETAQAGNARKGLATAIYPSHGLPTDYRYNSLNQLTWQKTPDGGESGFWYDNLGRLVVSQNARQAGTGTKQYSYTGYDALGRIKEVGEIVHPSTTMTTAVAFNATSLSNWISTGTKSQITRTYYDRQEFSITYNGFEQVNLRSRVSSVIYQSSDGPNYEHGVHYTYDIHGNVYSLVREMSGLDSIFQDFKIIDYEYELVSGNVLSVYYQRDSMDRFAHRYSYDADNRITAAYTSRDLVHWDKDADYKYYLHGPLARTKLGELNVQGLDYAYTIHGWLKGMNSERLKSVNDIGKDGNTGSGNQWVCPDVFGFGLGYYGSDYTSIGVFSTGSEFIIDKTGSDLQTEARALYNGNISAMVTAIGKFMNGGSVPLGKAYRYDQLNRIASAKYYNKVDTVNNQWRSAMGTLTEYASSYTYDPNGNILTLDRKGHSTTPNMDELTYHYYSNSNKLEYVDDPINPVNYDEDIDDQGPGNFVYDEVGNLVQDLSEGIASIEWTVYGKIRAITRIPGSKRPDLTFEYTPDGHRAAKHAYHPSTGLTNSTWYVRDAQGNVMATYSREWYSELDLSNVTLTEITDYMLTQTSAQALAQFFTEEASVGLEIPANELQGLKTDLQTAGLLDDVILNCSPISMLVNNVPMYNSLMGTYTDYDIYNILSQTQGISAVFQYLNMGCGSQLAMHMIGPNIPNQHLEEIFNSNTLFAEQIWYMYNPPGTYPGAATASTQLLNNQGLLTIAGDVVNVFNFDYLLALYNFYGSVYFENLLFTYSGPGGIKGCILSIIPAQEMLDAIYVLDPTQVWTKLRMLYSDSDLADGLFLHNQQQYLYEVFVAYSDWYQNVLSFDGMYTAEEYLELIKTSVYLGAGMYGNITDYLIEQGHTVEGWKYKVGEHNIYGSSRVGVHRTDLVMIKKHGQEDKEYTQEDQVNFAFVRGKRNYELSNHLGNVQVVITDKRIAVCNEELEVSRFEAEVLVATDYYPFGMIMPGRDWSLAECTEGFYDTSYSFDQLTFSFDVQTLTTGQHIELGYTLFPAMPLPVLTQYQSGHTLQDYIDEIVANGSSVPGFTFTQTDIDEVTFTVDASGGFLDCGDTFIIHAPWQSIYFYATCSEQVKWVQDCKDVGYRYGFNGQEKDNEIKGSGNSLDFGARIYDSRLGRWLSLDPYSNKFPQLSAYSFAANIPIKLIDSKGRDIINGEKKGTDEYLKVQRAIEIIYEVMPDLYNELNNNKDVVITIKLGSLSNYSEPEDEMGSGRSMKNQEATVHKLGHTEAQFDRSEVDPGVGYKAEAVLDESGNLSGYKAIQSIWNSEEGKAISSEVGVESLPKDLFVMRKNVEVTLADGLKSLGLLGKVLGHELGHVKYNLNNTTEAALSQQAENSVGKELPAKANLSENAAGATDKVFSKKYFKETTNEQKSAAEQRAKDKNSDTSDEK